MRFVHLTAPGTLGLNAMWLPTWIGINKQALEAIEKTLNSKVAGMPATEENLETINDAVIEVLVDKYPTITGLRDYLDGLKFVQI
jgi:hypothetical protein